MADFTRMVEVFDAHGVSFVSVIRAFNTTTSMGRLTLNVLLSFAQFEREVTGERIRDKIAASKRKGMWMGGTLPLGYDMPTPGGRALRVNTEEAEIVRRIFDTYLALGSVHALQRWLDDQGIRSKRRLTRSGQSVGGQPFSRGALFHLLRNRLYLGEIPHKGEAHPGLHAGIIDQGTFDTVQARLDAKARRTLGRRGPAARAPLVGRLFDADGHPMSPTFSYGRGGKLYRYYVSAPLQQGRRHRADDEMIRRVAAPALETLLEDALARVLPNNRGAGLDLPVRIELRGGAVALLLPVERVRVTPKHLRDGEALAADPADPSLLRLTLPVRVQGRGGRRRIEPGDAPGTSPDMTLVRALRAAHVMLGRDAHHLPVLDAAPGNPWRRRLVRLAFLAPAIQRAILQGQQPPGLTLAQLMDRPLPLSWAQQARILGFGGG
ncbi:MAG: recombinase family protein [Pseudomonadota bacterium]